MTTLEQTIPQNPEPTLPSDKRAAAIKALEANTKDLPPPEASPKPSEAEATEATETPAEETHEVQVSPDVELKNKIRARLAEADRREKQLQQQRADLEAAVAREREAIQQERQRIADEAKQAAEQRARLERLRREDPASFMKEAGWDRSTLKTLLDAELNAGKPETILQQMAARQERLEQELLRRDEEQKRIAQEAERAYQERQRAESVRAQESQFLDLAKGHTLLSRMAKRSPDLALQTAYAMSSRLQRENGGRLPDLDVLAARVEEELSAIRDEQEEQPTNTQAVAKPAKKPAITPKKAATPASAKPLQEMSEKERRSAAIAAFAELIDED